MSKKLSRANALDNISAWDTEEVLCLLRKVSEVRRCWLSFRRAAVAPHFAPFESSRGALNRCNFSADTDCHSDHSQRRNCGERRREYLTPRHRKERERKRERERERERMQGARAHQKQ